MRRIALAALPLALAMLPHAAGARITALDILERAPFADGGAFGPAGAYERIRATAHGELDPASPANAVIAHAPPTQAAWSSTTPTYSSCAR